MTGTFIGKHTQTQMAPAGCFDHYLIAEIMIETSSLGSGWRGCMWVRTWHSHSVSCWTVNPTVSQTQERDVLYPPSRHREREEGWWAVPVCLRMWRCPWEKACVCVYATHELVKILYIETCVTVSCGVEGDTPRFMPNVTSFMGQEQVSGWSGNGPDVPGLNKRSFAQMPFLIIYLE